MISPVLQALGQSAWIMDPNIWHSLPCSCICLALSVHVSAVVEVKRNPETTTTSNEVTPKVRLLLFATPLGVIPLDQMASSATTRTATRATLNCRPS